MSEDSTPQPDISAEAEKSESKINVWGNLKEFFKRSTPEQAAQKTDILGRVHNVLLNPDTNKLFMQALDIGTFASIAAGFVSPELVPVVAQAPAIARAMGGVAPEINPYLPGQAKVLTEVLTLYTGPTFVNNVTEVLQLTPNLNVRENAQKAAGAIDTFIGNVGRWKNEKRAAIVDAANLNEAARMFGTQLPHFATA